MSTYRTEHKIIDGKECKRCCSCKKWLEVSGFSKCRTAWDLLQGTCLLCKKTMAREHRKQNREAHNKAAREYRAKNLDSALERERKWVAANREGVNANARRRRAKNVQKSRENDKKYREKNHTRMLKKEHVWRENNRAVCNAKSTRWRRDNPEKARETFRKWYYSNHEKVLASVRKRMKKLYRTARGRLNMRMSNEIRDSLQGRKNRRPWQLLVGYTIEDLTRHLKRTIPAGYTIEDYGDKLHMDHIIPKRAFNYSKPEHPDFKRCWGLDNLRLIPKLENLQKSGRLAAPFQPMLALEQTS